VEEIGYEGLWGKYQHSGVTLPLAADDPVMSFLMSFLQWRGDDIPLEYLASANSRVYSNIWKLRRAFRRIASRSCSLHLQHAAALAYHGMLRIGGFERGVSILAESILGGLGLLVS
jgi:hypothetical protein